MKTKNFLVRNVIDSIDRKSKGTILRSMAIFTSLELCGSILTGKTGNRTTKDNFLEFCKSKYMPTKYYVIAELLYFIFRNGVAHSYIPKKAALLSGNYYDRDKHLNYYSNGLFIYVPQLSRDVRSAIRSLYNGLKSNQALQNNYNAVIHKLDQDGMNEYNQYITKANIKPKLRKIKRDIITEIL